jgi:hypothetical protein
MERFTLKKLNEVEGKEQYCAKVSNRFTAFENLEAEVDINRACKTIREHIMGMQLCEDFTSLFLFC